MLNGLDLFSGIGGISLALREWVRPVAYCENDKYCQSVLLSRMRSGDLSVAPVWDDVRTLRAQLLPEIEIIYGGFPCQDISTLGRNEGLAGKRSGLFYEITRLAAELKPPFIFLENIAQGINKHEQSISNELERIGYTARVIKMSAFDVGANHERLRWFCLAYANGIELREQHRWETGKIRKETQEYFRSSWWTREPGFSGVANGVSNRVDRLRALGNAVVPLQAREAFMILSGINTPSDSRKR